jgi:hypothetical protein
MSRSITDIQASHKAFADRRLDGSNREENRVLKVAEQIVDTTKDVIAKTESEAKAKAKAEAEAKAQAEAAKKSQAETAKPKTEPTKKRTPAAGKPAVDEVPNS